ncbi:MAG: hypothetical protein J3K34DRAFT_526426 [Monoraphidium minutum]|nr:MAG: hypothetical protein J3K34DRAFT_526426 [Monoraphidium minutum]
MPPMHAPQRAPWPGTGRGAAACARPLALLPHPVPRTCSACGRRMRPVPWPPHAVRDDDAGAGAGAGGGGSGGGTWVSGRARRAHRLQQLELEQPAPPPGGRAAARVDLAKMLTSAIAGAPTLQQLVALAEDNAARLDHIHAAALVCRAAQLAGAAGPLLQQPGGGGGEQEQEKQGREDGAGAAGAVPRLLCTLLAQRLRHATPASLAASLWGLGRLSQSGLGPQLAAALAAMPAVDAAAAPRERRADPRARRAPLLAALGARAAALAPGMSGQQLATSLWGLARAGLRPDAGWVEAFLAPVSAALDARRCGLTDCAQLLYALALMRRPPPAAFYEAWQGAVLALGLEAANPQDVSTMLWAAGSLGAAPRAEWLAAALDASGPRLGGYGPQALSNAIYGLAALGARPPDAWLAAFLAAVASGGDEGGGGDEGSSGGVEGGGGGVEGGSGGGGAAAVTPQAFSCTLASLAKLGAAPPPGAPWLDAMLARSAGALARFKPLELSNTAWALARLGHRPGEAWSDAFMGAARDALPGFTPHQLANVLWSLALLRRPPPPELLATALAALQPALRRLSPRARAGLLWSLSSLGAHPGRPWLAEFLSAAFDGGLAADGAACASVLFTVSAIDGDFLAEWLDGYLTGGEAAGGPQPLGESVAKYAQLAGAMAGLAAMDGRRLRAAWVELTDADWSGEPGAAGEVGAALQFGPPGFEDMYGGGGGGGVRLETELETRRRELDEETARNAAARLHVDLLHALAAVSRALHDMLGFPGDPGAGLGDGGDLGAAATAVDAADGLDAAVAALVAALAAGGSAPPTASGGGARVRGSGAGGAPASGGSGNGAGSGSAGTGGGASMSGSASGGVGAAKPGSPQPMEVVSGGTAALAGAAAAAAGGGASQAAAGGDPLAAGGTPAACAPASAGGGEGGEAALPGAVGAAASDFLGSVRAEAATAAPLDKDGFVVWWGDLVQEAGVIAHQHQGEPEAPERLKEILHQLGARTIAYCLTKPWFFELFNFDFLAAAYRPAPDLVWRRTASSLKLDSRQLVVFMLMNKWWAGHEASLQLQREELARAALAAPDDVTTEVAGKVARVLHLYKISLIPFMVLINTAILRPQQMAEYYVQPWPWMPVLTPILLELQLAQQQQQERRRQAREAPAAAAAAAAKKAGRQPPPG